MANNLNSNPITIDTFDADFALTRPISIKKIVVISAADADVFSLKEGQDDTGQEVVRVNQNSNLQAELDFGDRGFIFTKGLFFDSSAVNAGLDNGTDKVIIYLL